MITYFICIFVEAFEKCLITSFKTYFYSINNLPEYWRHPPRIESIKEPKNPLKVAIIIIGYCEMINDWKLWAIYL